jgi:pyruvate dehydrogenase E2 component (dihydrolipoamide acetyltransferase)
MATKVHMEALSPTMEEGQLVRWLKNEGDQIKEGDVLAEIETDKATMELVARGSGVLQRRLINEGQTAPVGQVIGVIAAEGEDISALTGDAGGGKQPSKEASAAGSKESAKEKGSKESAPTEEKGKTASKKPRHDSAAVKVAARGKTEQPREASMEGRDTEEVVEEPEEEEVEEQPEEEPGEARGDNGRGRVKASPLARKMAAESGLELSGVSGTGPGGRIVKRDIEAAGTAPPRAETKRTEAAPAARPQPRRDGAEVEEIPVTQMRKTIAKRLVTSIGPVPTFYLTIDVDMTRMTQARERVNERLADSGVKASINDFIIKAVAAALARHPEVNAAWDDIVIKRYHRVHIGVAVAVDEGLITPVIRDADQKGIAEISTEVRELAKRAREKKLKPDEYTGATFSISNLGMFGIDEFTAIINPPEAAILAVGQVADQVVAVNGQPTVQPRMRMTMSCDHRVVDGATGAKFLQTLRGFIEEPMMILV